MFTFEVSVPVCKIVIQRTGIIIAQLFLPEDLCQLRPETSILHLGNYGLLPSHRPGDVKIQPVSVVRILQRTSILILENVAIKS